MVEQLFDYIDVSLDLFNQSTERILWNLFLAFISLLFSIYLFNTAVKRNLFWWLSLLIFIVFLPNAPYVLTDSIHILELSQQNYPSWAIAIIVVPQYALFIMLGFEAYALSLIRLNRYLSNYFALQYVAAIDAIAHCLCTVGVYIGRFERFNSWDFVTRPGVVLLTTMQDLLDGWKLLSMAIASVVVWLLFELVRLVNERTILK